MFAGNDAATEAFPPKGGITAAIFEDAPSVSDARREEFDRGICDPGKGITIGIDRAGQLA